MLAPLSNEPQAATPSNGLVGHTCRLTALRSYTSKTRTAPRCFLMRGRNIRGIMAANRSGRESRPSHRPGIETVWLVGRMEGIPTVASAGW